MVSSLGFQRDRISGVQSVQVDISRGRVDGQNALDQLADRLGIEAGEHGATASQTISFHGREYTLDDRQITAINSLFGGFPSGESGNAAIVALLNGHLSEGELNDAATIASANRNAASHDDFTWTSVE